MSILLSESWEIHKMSLHTHLGVSCEHVGSRRKKKREVTTIALNAELNLPS